MNTIELTKKLISIPSYVNQKQNEAEIGLFLYNYFKKSGHLDVIKQNVDGKRFNLIVKDKYPTKVIFCGHVDTVQPGSGWKTDPLRPVTKNNCIYGLGASDMKGNLAALVSAFLSVKETKGLMLLFYVDEEYDLFGMRKFIDEYKGKIKPTLVISADGRNLSIGNGCRGVIEVTFVVQGKTGHASRPSSGNNAILSSIKAVENFIALIDKKYNDSVLGSSTCNLAFLQGGLDIGNSSIPQIQLGREGNNIPDIAEFVLDIRPASSKLTSRTTVKLFKKLLEEQGLKLREYKVRTDQGNWVTPTKNLKPIENLIKGIFPVQYLDIAKYGYIDIQMVWQAFGRPVSFTIGAGDFEISHKPNEFIDTNKLLLLEKAFIVLIKNFAKGGD